MSAEEKILAACRKAHKGGGFKTRGVWCMRQNVNVGGMRNPKVVPCAVVDVARTEQDPLSKSTLDRVPRVLALGMTWEEVAAALEVAGEFEG